LTPILRDFHDSSASERKIVFELGRFLTAIAGLYVVRVVSHKESRGKTFYMVDGGLHHHLAAAGTFGTSLRSNYAVRNLSQPDAPMVACSLAGPSCNPTDLLGIDVALPRPGLGNLIGVLKSGSYGFTASPLLFLGRRTPPELVRHNGRIVLGRRPFSMQDFN
jgi:diaminopimelate decarboxylase